MTNWILLLLGLPALSGSPLSGQLPPLPPGFHFNEEGLKVSANINTNQPCQCPTMEVAFKTETNKVYRMEKTTNFVTWEVLQPELEGTGEIECFYDPSYNNGFYRVIGADIAGTTRVSVDLIGTDTRVTMNDRDVLVIEASEDGTNWVGVHPSFESVMVTNSMSEVVVPVAVHYVTNVIPTTNWFTNWNGYTLVISSNTEPVTEIATVVDGWQTNLYANIGWEPLLRPSTNSTPFQMRARVKHD